MSYRMHGLGLAGLMATVALGALTFASSAQAAIEPHFELNNSVTDLHASATAKQLGAGTLLLPALNAEVVCQKFSVVSGLLESRDKATGSLLYEECVARKSTAFGLEVLPGCELVQNHLLGAQKPHITATATLLPTELLNGNPAILAENISAKILFHQTLGCPLPTSNPVTGELCLAVVGGNNTPEVEVEASQHIQGLCVPKVLGALGDPAGTKVKDQLRYGTQVAYAESKADMSLSGTHSGFDLGVILLAEGKANSPLENGKRLSGNRAMVD